MITANIPRLVIIFGDKVFVIWKEAPRFCTFCKKSGYKKPDCKDLHNAKINIKTMSRDSLAVPDSQPTATINTLFSTILDVNIPESLSEPETVALEKEETSSLFFLPIS